MERLALPIALAVLGLLLALLLLPAKRPEPPAPPSVVLWAGFAPQDVVEIRVIDKGDEGTLLRRRGERWTVQVDGGPEQPVRGDALRWGAVGLAGLRPLRQVEHPSAAPSDYGLGSSALQLGFTLAQGRSERLRIGDPLPVGEGRYARVDGDTAVYAIDPTPLLPLLADPSQWILGDP